MMWYPAWLLSHSLFRWTSALSNNYDVIRKEFEALRRDGVASDYDIKQVWTNQRQHDAAQRGLLTFQWLVWTCCAG